MSFPRKNRLSNPPPANGLASQSTRQHWQPWQPPFRAKSQSISQSYQQNQQPQLVCTWSAHTPQTGPSPFPRNRHTLTTTANVAHELFLFGGYAGGPASGDIYVISTRDLSTTRLQTSGEVPSPRAAHGAALIDTTLLICGGKTSSGSQNVLDHLSLYLLDLGTSDLLLSSPAPADHIFALQYRESGPALQSVVPDRALVATIP